MVRTVRVTTDNKVSILELQNWSYWEQEKAIGADCIEHVRTKRIFDFLGDDVVMIVDESGLIKNRPDNLIASFLYGADMHHSPIAGDVIFGIRKREDVYPPDNPELIEKVLKSLLTRGIGDK